MRRFLVFSALISLVVVIPLALSVSGSRCGADTDENRVLQTKLRLGGIPYKNWPDKINSWLNDSISFRSVAIDYYKIVWERCFRGSVGKRVQGRNGEFFARGEVMRLLGTNPIPFKRIRETKYAIASTQALCQLNGIPYMCFFIPDKSTLYQADIASYLLPGSGLSFAQQKGESYRQQLLRELEGETLNFYDLYPLLAESMKEGRVYNRKFDTDHWNAHGLMIGYEFIKDKMIKQRPEEFSSSTNSAILEFHTEQFEDENVVHIKFANPEDFNMINNRLPELISNYSEIGPKDWKAPVYIENPSKTKGRLFISSDSFLKNSKSVDEFCNGYGKIFPLVGDVHRYLHMHYDHMTPNRIKSVIENYHPDFYVEEFVEHDTYRFRTCKDPYMLILADFLLQTTSARILTPQETPLASLSSHNASWEEQGDALVFHSVGTESYISTAPPSQNCRITVNSDGLAVLIARIESPADTEAVWEVKLANEPNAEWTKKVFNMKKGLNHVRIEYEANPGDVLEWKFTPGQVSGDYVFKSIPEIKLIFRSHQTTNL
jgi:hypothetical protein